LPCAIPKGVAGRRQQGSVRRHGVTGGNGSTQEATIPPGAGCRGPAIKRDRLQLAGSLVAYVGSCPEGC
jgi:hypothetical protein